MVNMHFFSPPCLFYIVLCFPPNLWYILTKEKKSFVCTNTQIKWNRCEAWFEFPLFWAKIEKKTVWNPIGACLRVPNSKMTIQNGKKRQLLFQSLPSSDHSGSTERETTIKLLWCCPDTQQTVKTAAVRSAVKHGPLSSSHIPKHSKTLLWV